MPLEDDGPVLIAGEMFIRAIRDQSRFSKRWPSPSRSPRGPSIFSSAKSIASLDSCFSFRYRPQTSALWHPDRVGTEFVKRSVRSTSSSSLSHGRSW